MGLGRGVELATDNQFREMSNFATPPRAGTVTAIEPSGQVRVASNDPDGGDVLAWPLNGFVYALDDVVYIAFAENSPDSAIVLGSRSPVPSIDAGVVGGAIHGAASKTTPVNADTMPLVDSADGNILKKVSWLNIKATLQTFFNGLYVALTGNQVVAGVKRFTSSMMVGVDQAPVGTLHVKLATGNANAFIESVDGRANLFIVSPDTTKFVRFGFIQGGIAGADRFDIGMAEDGTGNLYIGDNNLVTKYVTILPTSGDVGLGVTPQGRFHAHDGTSGWLMVSKTGVNGTAQTVVPNGTGDVARHVAGIALIVPSSGVPVSVAVSCANGASQVLYSAGGNVLEIAVAANGAMTVRRTAGTATFSVTLDILWQ